MPCSSSITVTPPIGSSKGSGPSILDYGGGGGSSSSLVVVVQVTTPSGQKTKKKNKQVGMSVVLKTLVFIIGTNNTQTRQHHSTW